MSSRFRHFFLGLVALVLAGSLLGCDALIPWLDGEAQQTLQRCTPVASTQGPLGEWEYLGLGGEKIDDITAIAVHPCDPDVIYAGSSFNFSDGIQGRLFKSTDAGETWDTLLVGGSYRDIQFAPSDPAVMYALPGAILRSTDGGQTWTNVAEGIELDAETSVQSLAIHPEQSDVLYAGTGGNFGGGLYKTGNGGRSWREIGRDTALGNGVTSLAIDPDDPEVVYAGTAWSGSIVKSADGGRSWSPVTHAGGIIYDLQIDLPSLRVLYSGLSDKGILRSKDEGRTWHSFNEGLPDTTHVMEIVTGGPDKFFLTASWKDRGGIYRRSLDDSTWTKIGLSTVEQSYYYSDMVLSKGRRSLYVGLDGVYRLNLK